jgi:hypothetical protein
VRSVTLVLGVTVSLAACAGSTTSAALPAHGGASIAASAGASRPLRLAEVVDLNATQVVRGEPLSGALVVSNPGAAIDLNPYGCRPGFVVVLTNSSLPPFVGRWPASCVVRAFVIPHGTTRLPVSVLTTYLGCVGPGGAAPGLPPCLASGQSPPLPQGVYEAELVWAGPVPLPPAQPVVVTLVDKSS